MNRIGVAFLVLSLLIAFTVRGDLPGAQKYLDQAKKQLADKDPGDRIETTLRLAEAELDGVGAAEKDPVAKEIAGIRMQIKSNDDSAFKRETIRQLDMLFKTAEATLGARNAGINKTFDDIEKLLSDPKTTELLGAADVDARRKQLATFRKVSDDKLREGDVAEATRLVELSEKEFPEMMKDLTTGAPLSQDGAATKFQRRHDEYQGIIKDLPNNMPGVTELSARMLKMKVHVDAAYGAKEVAEILDRIKRNWEIGIEEMQGWEAETTPATFQQMNREQSQATSKLGAPKTVAAADRARRFFKSLSGNDQAKPYLQTPPLKEFVDSLAKLKTDTEAKLVTFADAILKEVEAATLTTDSRGRLESFVKYDLRSALEDHPQLAAFQQRGQALITKFDQGAVAGEAARQQAITAANGDAAARWPTLVADVDAVENFDPNKADSFVGKTIRLKNVYNRMGWDYGVKEGFDFAMDINGKPIAAHYSPTVEAAIKEYNATTSTEGLPEETPYDVIAVYDGTKGTLMKRQQVEGTVRTDAGADVSYRGEYKDPIEAPVLTIVGLHCGPVAVYALGDAAVAASNLGGGGGFFARLIALLVMLLAGLAVLVKAQFAPVASLPQLGAVRTNLNARNGGIIGVAFFALGLMWLIRGRVYYGLLGNLALIAGGLYLALELLEKQSWWKPQWSTALASFAVPIGLACAAIGVLRLFLSISFL